MSPNCNSPGHGLRYLRVRSPRLIPGENSANPLLIAVGRLINHNSHGVCSGLRTSRSYKVVALTLRSGTRNVTIIATWLTVRVFLVDNNLTQIGREPRRLEMSRLHYQEAHWLARSHSYSKRNIGLIQPNRPCHLGSRLLPPATRLSVRLTGNSPLVETFHPRFPAAQQLPHQHNYYPQHWLVTSKSGLPSELTSAATTSVEFTPPVL